MIRLYAEFDEPETLIRALSAVRAWGPAHVEAYTPYPVPEIERALAARPSRLSYAVFAAGIGAAIGAYALQWLLNAYLYPLNAGGRPTHFPLAFVPITFEMGVLFASLTAFAGVVVGGRLLRLWTIDSEAEGIESASKVHFWLEVVTDASGADLDDLASRLVGAGALAVRRVEVHR
jgi:hypothetical protein